MNTIKYIVGTALVALTGVAFAAQAETTREERMDAAYQNYRSANPDRSASDGERTMDRHGDRHGHKAHRRDHREDGAVRRGAHRAGDAIQRGAHKTGDAVRRGAHKAGHAVGTGVRKTGEALERTGDKIQESTKP